MKTAGRYPRFFTSYSGSGMTGVTPAILQWNGDGEGGPKGAELLCNRGCAWRTRGRRATHICTAPRGSNRHTLCKVSHGSRLVESRHPRDAGTRLTRTHDERSTPLGPMMMGARTLRGFAALTRGYRVVRPLRGRQLHGMPTGTTAPRGSNGHTLCTASHGSRQVESCHPRDDSAGHAHTTSVRPPWGRW